MFRDHPSCRPAEMTATSEIMQGVEDRATIRALEGQVSSYRQMIENVADVIIRGNAERRRTYVSPAVRAMLGYEPAELLYGGALDLVHPSEHERVAKAMFGVCASQPTLRMEFRMRRKDGVYLWIEGRYTHMREDGAIIAVLRDITDRKEAEHALAEANAKLASTNAALLALANQDGLTGLPNRRALDERLSEELSRARREGAPLGVALLDIDYFKRYNDCYGHLPGDDCLRRVSAAVAGALRRPSDFAARYGGEEIAVLLPATAPASALYMAERVRNAVASLRIEHRGSSYGFVTVSIGYHTHPPDAGADPADLIRAADAALYAAKAAGRNQVRGASGASR